MAKKAPILIIKRPIKIFNNGYRIILVESIILRTKLVEQYDTKHHNGVPLPSRLIVLFFFIAAAFRLILQN